MSFEEIQKDYAKSELLKKYKKDVKLIWLAFPCPCKLCINEKGITAKTVFFFECFDGKGGIYCMNHGLANGTGFTKL
jgi:hypothetical protein